MKKRTIPQIAWLVLLIAACSDPFPNHSVTLGAESPTVTPPPTKTTAPTSEATPMHTTTPPASEDGSKEILYHRSGEGSHPFCQGGWAIAPDSSLWVWFVQNASDDYVHYYHYSLTGELLSSFDRPIDYQYIIRNTLITHQGMWEVYVLGDDFYYHVGGASYVILLDFEGHEIKRFEIPLTFFMDAQGQYSQVAVESILWGGNGELLLDGMFGVHQLLNAHGDFQPIKALPGYPGKEGRTYRLLQNGPKQVVLLIGKKTITLDTELDRIEASFLGFAPDGSFYLETVEFKRESYLLSPTQIILYHYTATGEQIGKGYKHSLNSDVDVSVTLGADGHLYMRECDRPKEEVRISQLRFSGAP